MHFIVHCLDKPDALPTRLDIFPTHRAYILAAPIKVVVSGPLMAEDAKTPIGSCFLMEADKMEDVLSFHEGDPFKKAGIWETVHINVFDKRIDNR